MSNTMNIYYVSTADVWKDLVGLGFSEAEMDALAKHIFTSAPRYCGYEAVYTDSQLAAKIRDWQART